MKENAYTKQNLIDDISTKKEISKKIIGEILDSIEDFVVTEIKAEKDFRWGNFLSTKRVIRKERNGVNPRTKEKIRIPQKTVIKCSFNKNLFN